MAYVIAAVSIWLISSALTSLRPGRRGIVAAFAYPVGWAAGELPVQAITAQLILLGVLRWWGWPRSPWLGPLVITIALVVFLENLALIIVQFLSRSVVRRALANSPRRPLRVGRARDDVAGSWWRTMLQIPFHPRDVQVITNVAYGAHPRQVLDVWRTSRTAQGAPVIVYFHGGGWSFGDKREQGRPMLHEFVQRGWVVVTSNYRLSPDHRWPAHAVDAKRVLGFVKKYIANYGGDPSRVVVAGGSAGGHLAALLALSEPQEWMSPDLADVKDWSVRGCIALYSVLEMTGDELHWNGRGHGLRVLLEGRVVQLAYSQNVALYEQMSPYHRIHLYAPPFLVVQGGNDTLVDVNVARNFIDQFRRIALAPAYYVELPLTQHAFDHTASPRTSSTLRAAAAFAESVTQRARPSRSYREPPVEVRVVQDSGEWVLAGDVAAMQGTLYVIGAEGARTDSLPEDGERIGRELDDIVRSRALSTRRALFHSPKGAWPDEQAIAIVNESEEFCQALARSLAQHAMYEVTAEASRWVVLD